MIEYKSNLILNTNLKYQLDVGGVWWKSDSRRYHKTNKKYKYLFGKIFGGAIESKNWVTFKDKDKGWFYLIG